MQNSSNPPQTDADRRLGLAALAAVFLFTGVGCDLGARIDLGAVFNRLPAPEDRSAAVTDGLGRNTGLWLELRPSKLGATGAIEGLIGTGETIQARLTASASDSLAFEWTHGERKGTIRVHAFESSHELLLPAFWKEGETETDTGALWLSASAFEELKSSNTTDVRIGLGDDAYDAASNALKSFNAIAQRLSISASATAEIPGQPFAAGLKGTSTVFPLRVDGRLERVRVLIARSWFAEYAILDNPGNPLVLKVSVNPLAMEALRAFSPQGIDPQAVGYEITSVVSSSP